MLLLVDNIIDDSIALLSAAIALATKKGGSQSFFELDKLSPKLEQAYRHRMRVGMKRVITLVASIPNPVKTNMAGSGKIVSTPA